MKGNEEKGNEIEVDKNREECHGDVTVTKTPAPTSNFSSFETANAINEFNDPTNFDVTRLYTSITNQANPPYDQLDRVCANLKIVLDYYGDVESAIPPGKGNFDLWCKTKGKSGKPYSPLNPAWIEKWIEAIAREKVKKPVDDPNPVAIQIKSLAEAKSI